MRCFIATLGAVALALDSRFFRVENTRLLGSDELARWELINEGLALTMPPVALSDLALVFRIERTFK